MRISTGITAAAKAAAPSRVLVDVTSRVESDATAAIIAFTPSGAAGFASLDEAVQTVVAYTPHRERAPRPEGPRKNLRQFDGR